MAYPIGYEGSVYVRGFESVMIVNSMMGLIQEKAPDLILFGCQSNTVPYHAGGARYYPIAQHELLLGCQADAYILLVSVDDDVHYIRRTISYLEALFDSKVLALAISPLAEGFRWSTISSSLSLCSSDEMNSVYENLIVEFKLPVFKLSDKCCYKEITNLCIDYFSS